MALPPGYWLRPWRLGLGLVLLTFAALATGSSLAVPLLEVPDELGHADVVLYYATFRRLPPLPNLLQESHQPPLYYLLLAPLAVLTGFATPADFYRYPDFPLRPISQTGALMGGPGLHLLVHGPADAFPYRDLALTLHLLRLATVPLGLGVVGLTAYLARLLWPTEGARAVLAAAAVAGIPYFTMLTGAVTNDPLAALVGALLLTATVRLVIRPVAPGRAGLAVGVVAGLALLTKVSLLPLLPFPLLTLLVRTRPAWPRAVGALFLGLGGTAGWYLVHNLARYGEPLPLAVHHQQMLLLGQVIAREPRTLAGWLTYLVGFVTSVHHSFWGLFGIYNLPLPGALYQAWGGLGALALAGGLWALRRSRSRPHRTVAWLLAAMSVVQVLAVLSRDQQYFGAQGRYLYPVLPAWGLLLAGGLLAPCPPRWRPLLAGVVAGGLLALSAGALLLVVLPAYRQPAGPPLAVVPVRLGAAAPQTQEFQATQAGLRAIAVLLGTYHGLAAGPVTLRLESPAGDLLAETTLDARTFPDNQFVVFPLPPQPDSAGRRYRFTLRVAAEASDLPPPPAVYVTLQPPPEAGQRWLGDRPVPFSLAFRLLYR